MEFALFVARTDQLLRRGRSAAVDIAIARGDDDGAIARIRKAIEDDPYDEGLYRRLMLVHYRAGRAQDALAAYKEATARLGEDLGLEPSPELAELEEQILLHTVTPAHQGRAGGLPAEVTSLIGRAELLRQATELLEANRLVSLTGLPGAGKTRLALRIAHEAQLSVWFEVPKTESLSELRNALRSTIQRSFPHAAIDSADPLSALSGVDGLVVFDGLQRSEAAASLVEEALSTGPGVSVLTTTRTPTGRRDEWALTVPPLEPMDVKLLMRERLGRESAIDVAQLVEATGGLPGPIETAAVAERIGGTGIEDLGFESFAEEALSGIPTDLRAAVPNLSLLQPPFDVVAAGIAIGADVRGSLDGLSTLVDAGVVLTTDGGLAVHPLVRSQVLDTPGQLDVDGVLGFLGAHADQVDLSDRAVRRALDAADGAVDRVGLDNALAALVPVWWNRGPRRGHSDLLRPDLWGTFDAGDPRTAHLLNLATHMSLSDNDVPKAVEMVHRHAEISGPDDPLASSRHDQLLGHLALFTGDLPSAIDALKRAARTAIDADAPNATAIVASLGFVELVSATGATDGLSDRVLLTGRSHPIARPLAAELDGHRAWMLGDLDAADLRLSQAISGYTEVGGPAWAAPAIALLARVACHRDDADRAASLLAGTVDQDDTAAVAAARALASALHGDADAASHALVTGARSLSDGTNPIWTYRLLSAAIHAGRALPALGYDPASMAGAAAQLASDGGLRIPAVDAPVLADAEGDASPAGALAVLRSL